MPNPRMKHRRVVHKSTAGILKPIPEAVDLVGNPPPGLTTKTVALLQQRGSANRRSRSYDAGAEFPAAETVISAGQITFAPPTGTANRRSLGSHPGRAQPNFAQAAAR